MACSIEKNAKNGKINKILGKDGKTSTLFQEIFNVPTLTLNEAIEAFKNTYSDKIRYQIIGEKGASKVEQYQQTLNQAKTLEKQGKDYSKTGWFKNEQGQWKYFSNEILNEFLSLPQVKNKIVDLKDLLKKDSILLKAYPELENTKIEFYEGTKGADFRGDERINGTVTEEGETTILHIRTDSKGTADYGGILVHELNHKLQRIDNFARGGSPKFLLKLAIFITNSQNLPNKDAVNKIKNFDTSSLDKESKKIIEIVQKAFNNPSKATQLLEDGYFLLQGEIDSRAVELALELKNKLGRYKNFTYSELVKELGKREGIDLINEAISIFVDDVALSKQAVKAPQITQEIIDRLKQNGLSGDVFLLSTEEINAKLIELGVSEDIRKQVIAWHGSPYSFDRFTTEKMGTGEGAQAFGWGLYFTDLESIARNYAKTLVDKVKNSVELKNNIELSNESIELRDRLLSRAESVGFAEQVFRSAIKDYERLVETPNGNPYGYDQIMTEDIRKRDISILEDLKKMYNGGFKISEKSKNLYKVSLHKGKTPSEYTWLEWDREIPKNLISNIRELEKELFEIIGTNLDSSGNKIDIIEGTYGKSVEGVYDRFEPEDDYGNFIDWLGQNVYQNLDNILFDNKQASLLLLKHGIDGVKYPAESISRGATSDTARGFNYVVFDENAITIEEQIQFQKSLNNVGINLITNGFTVKEYPTNSKILDILIAKNVIEKVC